jgi:N-acetylneuraminic acid mutarotase
MRNLRFGSTMATALAVETSRCRSIFCSSLFMVVATAAVVAVAFSLSDTPTANSAKQIRVLTFAERVAYQRAIEEVYWRHRIWPSERPNPKPTLDTVMSRAQLEKKVTNYLRTSQALGVYWQRPITAEQLQAEMDRMAQHTKQPEVLRELFEALGNDPFVIAECLARPALAARFVADLPIQEIAIRCEFTPIAGLSSMSMAAIWAEGTYTLPKIPDQCIDDAWAATSTTNAPSPRYLYTAVWTGSEMIVWGGSDGNHTFLNTGGRYNPSTDSWTATGTTDAPSARYSHTAVWTGSEMIVWGGSNGGYTSLNTGGRYNPSTDSWTATSTTNSSSARVHHTAVWSGSEMIVWGGIDCCNFLNTGGRYNPITDSWAATSTGTSVPDGRDYHTAVWTGSEMIVWGGNNNSGPLLITGGRYNPATDSWTATSTINAPAGRLFDAAVWTGGEMIVWGGTCGRQCGVSYNTGGRYNPMTDNWIPTSTSNAPSARNGHAAVWTGSEMIIWGGELLLNTGGRYTPSADSWTPTSTTNAPSGRDGHTAAWTGSEMIVWGGGDNTGGRYCAESGPTPTPSPTPTPKPSPIPRPRPTPRPR